jgi:hypothetical protein
MEFVRPVDINDPRLLRQQLLDVMRAQPLANRLRLYTELNHELKQLAHEMNLEASEMAAARAEERRQRALANAPRPLPHPW